MEQQATRTTDGAPRRELLQMEHISKSFPGVKALDDVSLTVKAGTVLCVLEAMKMENEIPAPKDGKVAQVVVTKGATVGAGDTLVVLA